MQRRTSRHRDSEFSPENASRKTSLSCICRRRSLLLSLCSQVFPKRGILERKLLLFVFLSDVALPGSFMEDIGNASYIGGFDILPRKNVDIDQAVSVAGMIFGFALEIWV